MKRILAYLTISVLAACGGGGGGDEAVNTGPVDNSGGGVIGGDSPPNSLSFEELDAYLFDFKKISNTSYETESPTVTLTGHVGVTAASTCGGSSGNTLTITNDANGSSMTAITWVECGFLGAKVGHWEVRDMPLGVGVNGLTAEGGGDTVSISITRVIDVFPPAVVVEYPDAGSSSAAPHTMVRARFDDYMDVSTINTSTILLEDPAGRPLPGNVFYDINEKQVEFRPAAWLDHFTTYTVRITAAIRDDVGNAPASEHTWTFTTADDGTPPTKLLESPAAKSVCIAPDSVVAARFDEPLVPASVTPSTFVVEDSAGNPVTGIFLLDNLTATFTPDADLAPGETYTVNLTSGITDNGGAPLADQSWSFSTRYEPEGTWTQIATPPISGRSEHTAVWTGSEMIIYGGTQGNTLARGHARYDPSTDRWAVISDVNAPVDRRQHSATWTGSELIVWGGRMEAGTQHLGSGGRYNPIADSWLPMSRDNAPSARFDHSAVWTGTELIVWGGKRVGQVLNDGARYDPVTDTWTAISTINAPAPRSKHHVVWDGERMIVWGGEPESGSFWAKDGAVYDPETDVWSPLPAQNAPDPSHNSYLPSSVAWTGNDMFVWSHWNDVVRDPWTDEYVRVMQSEARRFGANDEWQTVVDACESEAVPNAAWLNGRFFSWNVDFTDGYFYDEQRDAWVPVTPFAGLPVTDATVIATEDSVIVFGGKGALLDPGRKNVGYRLELP